MNSDAAVPLAARSRIALNRTPASIVVPRLTVDQLMSGLTRLQRNIRCEADLDRFLRRLVEATRLLLGATGAAIALRDLQLYRWRARCGEVGPPIGAPLYPDFGVSGECLVSGRAQYCVDTSNDARVDPGLCQQLGLASIAVAPIATAGNTDGILEAWSSRYRAFDRRRLELLQDLATLGAIVQQQTAARRTRTVRAVPQIAKFVAQQASCNSVMTALRTKWMPAARKGICKTERCAHEVLAILRRTRERLAAQLGKVAKVGLRAALVLVLLAVPPWAAWRAKGGSATSALVSLQNSEPRQQAALPVNTVLESPSPFLTHASATLELAPQQPRTASLTSTRSLLPEEVQRPIGTKSPRVRHRAIRDDVIPPASAAVQAGTVADNALAPLSDLVSFRPPVPALAVSHALLGGNLRIQTGPVYPDIARSVGLVSKVRFRAVIDEHGHVQKPTFAEGHPILTGAAIDAVKQLQYQPYSLNDQRLKMLPEINVVFKQK